MLRSGNSRMRRRTIETTTSSGSLQPNIISKSGYSCTQWLRRFSYALGSAPHKGLRRDTAGLKPVRLLERRLRKNQRAAQRQKRLYPSPLSVPSTVIVSRIHIIALKRFRRVPDPVYVALES